MTAYLKYKIWTVIPVALIILSGFTSETITLTENETVYKAEIYLDVHIENLTPECNANFETLYESRDCTVRIKTDDMDIEITLHDVSWWDCTRLKLKALWEFGFD